jgi:hypothetical protein
MNVVTFRGASALFTAMLLLTACEGAQPLDPIANPETADVATARASAQNDAPSNAQATASSTSRINIGWQDNATNDGYLQPTVLIDSDPLIIFPLNIFPVSIADVSPHTIPVRSLGKYSTKSI